MSEGEKKEEKKQLPKDIEELIKSLMPAEGPRIYVVKTQRGRELQVLFLISERVRVKGLRIYSAFVLKDLPGVIFVEAPDYRDVLDAIRGFPYTVLASYHPLPPQEAQQFIDKLVAKPKVEAPKELKLEPGVWVRIVGGLFKGHVARVVSVEKKRILVELKDLPGFPVEVSRDEIEVLPPEQVEALKQAPERRRRRA